MHSHILTSRSKEELILERFENVLRLALTQQTAVCRVASVLNAHSCTPQVPTTGYFVRYCTELATCEKTVLALEPINRIVPTTITRITASMTAYSAMSCAWSSDHSRARFEREMRRRDIFTPT